MTSAATTLAERLLRRLPPDDFERAALVAALQDTDGMTHYSRLETQCAVLTRLLKERLNDEQLALFDALWHAQEERSLYSVGTSVLAVLALLAGEGVR